VNTSFWRGKRVLITGHTGFKGSWLSLWLQRLGAQVTGYALPAPQESLFELARVEQGMASVHADIRDLTELRRVFGNIRPEIVLHLAAQALVRQSYVAPVETFEVNVMGTVNVLEAARGTPGCRVVLNVTSDKCYQNNEWPWGYRENDPLGGHDPYSSSKACSELVTSAYRNSFAGVAVGSARAGNVIGGGDFSKDRLIPDIIRAIREGRCLEIRSPDAIRPWQHVLEPLSGYLKLVQRMWEEPGAYAQSWNFGPLPQDVRTVGWIADKIGEYWDGGLTWRITNGEKPHEAHLLALDSSKARTVLGWRPRWGLERALQEVIRWHRAHARGEPLREQAFQQIAAFEETPILS